MTTLITPSSSINDRLCEILDLHLHPQHGSAFWLKRSQALGIDLRQEIRTVEDLSRLEPMSPAQLRGQPLRHFVPRALHRQWHRLIVAQTGGTTGQGAWTAYTEEDFDEAFIAPFEFAAPQAGFPLEGQWLYIGPSGPHIIGKVLRQLARSVGSADPFSVDFDPRWAKRLPPGSFAFLRYLDHVTQQAIDVIDQQDISVLFTTPAVLSRLATAMSPTQREAIRGLHYGGMALAPTDLHRFQTELFPQATHLSGYGNTLFGCCMELHATAGRDLDYYPYGNRLFFEALDDAGRSLAPGSTGQVCFTRLDRSMLILRMCERDESLLLEPPLNAPPGFLHRGVRNPHSPIKLAPQQRPGLY